MKTQKVFKSITFDDYEDPSPAVDKDKPSFKFIDNTGEWSTFALRSVFKKLGCSSTRNISIIVFQLDAFQLRNAIKKMICQSWIKTWQLKTICS